MWLTLLKKLALCLAAFLLLAIHPREMSGYAHLKYVPKTRYMQDEFLAVTRFLIVVALIDTQMTLLGVSSMACSGQHLVPKPLHNSCHLWEVT